MSGDPFNTYDKTFIWIYTFHIINFFFNTTPLSKYSIHFKNGMMTIFWAEDKETKCSSDNFESNPKIYILVLHLLQMFYIFFYRYLEETGGHHRSWQLQPDPYSWHSSCLCFSPLKWWLNFWQTFPGQKKNQFTII